MKCARCPDGAMVGKSLCPKHVIRSRVIQWKSNYPLSAPYFPSKKGFADELANNLIVKLRLQENRCAVSNCLIDLSTNAHIDHVIPVSLDPSLAFDIDNLRWVEKTINLQITKGVPRENKCHNTMIKRRLMEAVARSHNYEQHLSSDQLEKWKTIVNLINQF
jgi:5-methylcytosine-specific restriction endonuclease McrA